MSEITADKLNRILAEIKRNRPVVAAPLSARVTGDGTHISIKVPQGNGGTSAPLSHPFKVITTTIDDALYWGIIADSRAWTSLVPSDNGNVIGLLTTGAEDDPGWAEVVASSESDYIYLEWNEEESEARIRSVGNGGNLDPTLNDVETAGNWLEIELVEALATFKFARKIIARADPGENGPTITQFVTQHQLLQDICYDGNPAKYWFDFTKGITAP